MSRIVTLSHMDHVSYFIRELRGFSIDYIWLNQSAMVKVDLSSFDSENGEEDGNKWLDELITHLPSMIEVLKRQGERNPNFAYNHILSYEEIVLLLKKRSHGRGGEQYFITVANAIDVDIGYTLTKFIRGETPDTQDYTQFNFFVQEFFLPYEVDFIQKRDRNDLKYGDAIVHYFLAYRNEGVYLYDGNQGVTLATNMDAYGNIPISFPSITQFPIMYFSETIDHNRYIWIPKGISVEAIIQDYQIDNIPYLDNISQEVTDQNYRLSSNIRMIVLKVRQGDSYVVWLYDDEKELNFSKLLTQGMYGQWYDDHVAVINGDTFLGLE